jgi:hypothetical protein
MLAAQALVHPVGGVVAAVVAAAGVSGSAPTSHFSLAARVHGYTQGMLEQALVEERSLVRVAAMRSSVYLLPTNLAAYGLAPLPPRTLNWFSKILEMSVAGYRQLASCRTETGGATSPTSGGTMWSMPTAMSQIDRTRSGRDATRTTIPPAWFSPPGRAAPQG